MVDTPTPTNRPNVLEASEPAHVVQVGIDLARKVDFTSICVMEVRRMTDGSGQSIALVRQWERLDKGMAWDQIWSRCARTLERVVDIVRENWQLAYDEAALRAMDAAVYDPQRGPRIVRPPEPMVRVRFDGTGVGDPMGEEIAKETHPSYERNLRFYPVYFNHGDRIKSEGGVYSLGKSYMVSYLQAMQGGRRLKVSPGIYNAREALQELEDYEVEITPNMNEKYGAFRVGAHDDMVTSLGLACIDIRPPSRAIPSGTYYPEELGLRR